MTENRYRDEDQDALTSSLSDWRVIKRLLTYFRPYVWMVIFAVLFLIAAKAIEAVVPLWLGKMTQQILEHKAALFNNHIAWIAVLESSFVVIGLLIAGYIFESINTLLKNWVGQKAILTLRSDMFRHIQQMHVGFFDKHAIGRLMTRTIHDIDQISQMFTDSLIPLFGSLILFVGVLVGIYLIDWKVALVITALFPLVAALTIYFRVNQKRCYDKQRTIVSTMNVFVQEHLMGAAVTRNFGLHDQERRKFEVINHDLQDVNMETTHYFAFFFAGVEFLQSFILISIFVALVLLAPPDIGFRAGAYFAFSLYVLMLFRPLADVAERYNVLQSALAAARKIFYLQDLHSEIKDAAHPKELGVVESIAFRDVWFAYKENDWVLKGISFEMKRGESIAFVGITGSGKTTMMSLLLRFYDIQRGSIEINGIDIREYSLSSLRSHFGIVLQDPVIFSGSIRDNITLFQKEISEVRVQEAVDYVNLRPLLTHYSDGLDHHLKERGTTLSQGEKQLVAFARAVAHESDILVLDEAMANIDSNTEKMIQDALRKLLKEKTSIVIAHRLSTIKNVTRIYLIHRGHLVERGSHAELLALKGIYEKLYRLQFCD